MPSSEEKEYLRQFKLLEDAEKNSHPHRQRHWQISANNYFAYQGVKLQYGAVDYQNKNQQQSFFENMHFYETGKFRASNNFQAHLAILRQCQLDGEKWSASPGKFIGKLGDAASIAADKIPHPYAQLFKYAWALGGDEIKDAIKDDSQKKFAEAAVDYIRLHSNNPAALSEFMKEFPISDERVQKALWEQQFKNRGLSAADADQLSQKLVTTLKDGLIKQAKENKSTKQELQQAFSSEMKQHAAQLSGSIDELKEQVGDLSEKFSRHLAIADELKRSNDRFVYAEAEIKGFATCAQFLGSVAAFTKSTELVNLAKFAQGASAVADAVNKLQQLQTASSLVSSVVGPLQLTGGYAAVGLAVFSLATSFMDQGPSGDQLILEYLQELWTFIGKEFEKVHQTLNHIHKDMYKGFTSVLEACQKIFDLVNETLNAVHVVGKQIQDFREMVSLRLDQIHAEIKILEGYVKAAFERVAIESFNSNLGRLDDLLTGQDKQLDHTQALLNELVGDHLLGRSPVDFYTGAFYFDRKLFHDLTPNSTLLFFSPLREFDIGFVDSNDRHAQALRINAIVALHGLSSLIGFFAAYAETILKDQYQSVASIQHEIKVYDRALSNTKSDIKKKEKTLSELKKDNPDELEKKQLEQEQKNLEKLHNDLCKHKKSLVRLQELKPKAEASEKKNDEYKKEVQEKIKKIAQKKTELDGEIKHEKDVLKTIKSDMRQLSPAFDFLYHAQSLPELTAMVALYQEMYKRHLQALLANKIPAHDRYADFVKEKLDLSVDKDGKVSFDEAGKSHNASIELREKVYQKAFGLVEELCHQNKKVAALTLQAESLAEENVKLDHSLKLASAYERKPLTENLVFNTNLWISAVQKYLKVISSPNLASHYQDHHQQHVQQIIVMGKNFLHFIASLQNNEELFAALWRGYAISLIRVHRYYQEKWEDTVKDLREKELKEKCEDEKCKKNESILHLVNRILVDPKLVFDQEVDFAEEILKNGAKFKEYLEILESQKNILLSFYQLVRPNRAVSVIAKLWGKEDIESQLGYMVSRERIKAAFTTLEVYEYLNQKYLDIAEVGVAASDFISSREISSLIAHLEWHAATANSHRQMVLYDWASQSSLQNAQSVEYHSLTQSINKELFMQSNALACLLSKALENAHMGNTQNAIVYVGETRAGKSTFIAYMLDCIMEFLKTKGTSKNLIAKDCPAKKVPAIGHDRVSKTLFPAGYEYKGDWHIDFPGWDDTRPADQALLSVFATQVAIKTIGSIKRIVVVIDLKDIQNKNAKNLAKIVSSVSRLFKNFRDHRDAITLVVSKLHGMPDPDETIEQQKERIIAELEDFVSAIKSGNYGSEINDPQLVSDFLSIFIDKKDRNNLTLFYPSTSQAKHELLAQMATSQPFSSNVMNFVGNDEHRKQFYGKIDGTLQQALTVLNSLLQYPNEKLRLENRLNEIRNQQTVLESEIKEANQQPEAPVISEPYPDYQFEAKRNELGDLQLDIERLVVQEANLSKEIAAIEARTELVVVDHKSWREEDYFPGRHGTPDVRSHPIERTGNAFTDVQTTFTEDCNFDAREGYVCNYGYPCKHADRLKDGRAYCHDDYSHVIPAEKISKECPVWYKKSDGASKGYVSDVNSQPHHGTYKATYHTPRHCYGEIKVTFSIQYREQPPIKEQLNNLKQKLTETKNSISEKHAKRKETTELLRKMKEQNDKADENEKNRQNREKARRNKLDADKTAQASLKTEEARLQSQLNAMKTVYDENYKNYCDNQSFWKQLVELNEILKFDFEKFAEFKNRFNEVVVKLVGEKCAAPTLACDEDLFELAKQCDTNKLSQLLESRPNLNAQNLDRETALDIALSCPSKINRNEFLGELIKAGARECKKENARTIVGKLYHAYGSDSEYQEFCRFHGLAAASFEDANSNTAGGFGATGATVSYHFVQDLLPVVAKMQTEFRSYSDQYSSAQMNETSALVPYQSTQYSYHSVPYDAGAWDASVQKHDVTGEPVFTYRVYKMDRANHSSQEMGSARFYKHPLLCRSSAGDRHNMISATGVLSQFNVDTNSIEDICDALPPTTYERISASAKQGAVHGTVRGFSTVIGQVLLARHVSPHTANRIQQTIYYLSCFTLDVHQQLSQHEYTTWESIAHAVFNAAYNTASILIMNHFIHWFCKGLSHLEQAAHQKGWNKTGNMFRLFKEAAPYSVYACNAVRNGLLETASSIASGAVMQTAIEQTGKASIRFLTR